jgi:hypothetical protein
MVVVQGNLTYIYGFILCRRMSHPRHEEELFLTSVLFVTKPNNTITHIRVSEATANKVL